MIWFWLEAEPKANKEAIGLYGDIAFWVEVKQTKAIATKQVELTELQIGTEYGIKVETAVGIEDVGY